MKPSRKSAPLPDRLRQAGQTEKNGLKDILGIVAAIDQATGGSQHHRTVAGDQQFKCLAIIGGNEAIQQHRIFRRHGFIAQSAKVALQDLS